jgi:hypothetical protein
MERFLRLTWIHRNLVYDFRANNRGVNGRDLNVESYLGGEDQAPDELIESLEGIGLTPAYRDHAYLRFETIDLSRYGNRLPPARVARKNILSATPTGWKRKSSTPWGEFLPKKGRMALLKGWMAMPRTAVISP